ncbi:MAG TPA: GNAT family N-acetyltransferase [Thermoanaerobaculia bacterium]|jgi:GNAT superfamily N-acetyltransferase|nr:GNAT family N-acetyltransferase [Thermoanaerobaculia bacterium]
MEWQRGEYAVSADPGRLDLDVVHGFLTRSYWAEGIPRRTVLRSIAHSLPFGLYHVTAAGERQVGFARAVSDYATFAYLADVFVLDPHRGQGLGIWLVECVVAHPELQALRRWLLATRDAHSLYRRFGWSALAAPDRWLERLPAGRYARDMGDIGDGEEG